MPPPPRRSNTRGSSRSLERTRSNLSRTSTGDSHRKGGTSGRGHKDHKSRQREPKQQPKEPEAEEIKHEEESKKDLQQAGTEEPAGSIRNTPEPDVQADQEAGRDNIDEGGSPDQQQEKWATHQDDPTDADVESNLVQEDDGWEVKSVTPEEFDSKSFILSLENYTTEFGNTDMDNLQADDGDSEKLKKLINNVSVTLTNFKNYSIYSQQQIENLRDQVKMAKKKLHQNIQKQGLDLRIGDRDMTEEERLLHVKLRKLNVEIAAAAEELARANKYSTETEAAAIEASLAAEQAAEEAKRMEMEMELKARAEERKKKKVPTATLR